MTPRDALAQLFAEINPGAHLVNSEKKLDVLRSTTIILKQQGFRRTPVAPLSSHLVDFVVTVVSSLDDREKAEDALDAELNLLIHDLDARGVVWTEARKVTYDDRYLAYDITIELESNQED